MKKVFFGFALALSMVLIGCSSDDNENNTRSCDLLGLVPATFTDNGDGTVTFEVEGESETIDLEGTDFDTFVDQVCSGDLELDFGQ